MIVYKLYANYHMGIIICIMFIEYRLNKVHNIFIDSTMCLNLVLVFMLQIC